MQNVREKYPNEPNPKFSMIQGVKQVMMRNFSLLNNFTKWTVLH